MTDLVAFIEARLDEDEAVALGARRYPPGHNETDDWHPVALLTPWDTRVDEHIARHDPARVLRELESKRGLITTYRHAVQQGYPEAALLEHLLRGTAYAWADHSDYDSTWGLA